jgi:hypothetical protein
MRNPTDKEIEGALVRMMSDAFNRSLGALENVGALNTKKLREHYRGIGSKYYDVVTEQMELTARDGKNALRRLYDDAELANDNRETI